MKLQDAIKQLVSQLGESAVSEVRLANFLADMNAYEEYPAMKRVLREMLKNGFGKKLFEAFKADRASAQKVGALLAEQMTKDYNYKPDLVAYGFGCLLYGLGCADNVKEPLTKSFDPFSKGDEDLLDDLPEMLSALQAEYVEMLDTLPTIPADILRDAPAYYSAAALGKLYAVEAKIAAVQQALGDADTGWCRNRRAEKTELFKKQKADAVEQHRKARAAAARKAFRQKAYVVISAAALVFVVCLGINYFKSTKAINQFEQTIVHGEQSASAGNYGKALRLFVDAKKNYDGSLRPEHYASVANKHIASAVAAATAKSKALAKRGELRAATALLASLPQDVLANNKAVARKVGEAKAAIGRAAKEGFDSLVANISQNGGHLDERGRKQLRELLAVDPDDYWLNFIKQREQ